MSGWIGVDLDGTLAHYDGWKGVEHIGVPIGPMVARVKAWLAEGKEVRIFTARIHDVAFPEPGQADRAERLARGRRSHSGVEQGTPRARAADHLREGLRDG